VNFQKGDDGIGEDFPIPDFFILINFQYLICFFLVVNV